jgi:glycosyltransferase involved in cell wall biosynthesis
MAVADLERPKAIRGLPGATILHILPALIETPAARAVVDTAVALLRSGARVLVAAEDGPLNSELQGLGGEWVRFVTESTNPIAATRNARTLANLVATERVDLVHAVGAGASRSAAALKKRAGIWVVHTYDTRDLSRPHRDRSYARALGGGDRVIVPSQYVAEQVAARHQIAPEKLAVIPRRIDGARFDPPSISPERAMVLRRGWKIARGQRVVLMPGRIDPAKGQLTLVEAARILTNGGLRNVLFVLAGDNREHFDYAKTMAMGRPVIASSVGALPEFVLAPPNVLESARTGWVAEPDDPVSFARALADALAAEASAYGAIGTRARRLAHQFFTPARTAAAALDLYANLFEGRG